ncbi:MAG: transposase [Ignavibacteriales bacterium]|nr:transposase [Ignavibacteriales bacterium]MCF8304809.1 transposase [Ignavibacteriales bacterium]MCF8314498.1 transposase [Ignavibacteriales bacterium]MCF8436465.1 transposase [Ignavibacteriales bacterium]
MKKAKRQFTAEFKVEILREHLENQISIGKLCEKHEILELPLKPLLLIHFVMPSCLFLKLLSIHQ